MSPDLFRQKMRGIRNFALDMDGTIFLGSHVFPFAVEFLKELERRSLNYIFLSNNSSRSVHDYYKMLREMGVPVRLNRIYTSAEATMEYLVDQGVTRIYLVGTKSLRAAFLTEGFQVVSENPQAVVVGFDTELTYEKLNRACAWIRQGVPFVATHPDLNCPIENGEMLPDCGAISAAITAATGVVPKILGKPNPEMLGGLQRRLGARPDEMVLVGDRLMTDIQMGRNFGILTVLVLTGEATRSDVAQSSVQPDFIVERISDLLDYLPDD